MPQCVYKRQKITNICTGDLQFRINIISREQTYGSDDDYYDVEHTTIRSVWALIENVGTLGVENYVDVNTNERVTHNFYIKYTSNLDITNTIQYNDKYFRIVSITNLEERNKYLVLHCRERGNDQVEANRV